MALDTKNKRSSAINPGCPWRGLWPAPDGTIGQGDRQAVAYLYSGILAGAPVPAATGPYTFDTAGWFSAGAESGGLFSAGATWGQINEG